MITDAVIRLFRHLDEGGLAIASSRRLARQVEQRYADWKVDAGAAAWATPRIRVYEDWLAQIWFERFEHGAGAPRLLSDDQELLLWQQVIRRHASKDTPSAVLQLSATARSVRRSWARVHDWRLDWQGIRQYRGADSDAFTDWAGHYERMLAGRNWLSSSQLPQYLVQHAAQWLPDLGCPAVWMGFDVIPPALEALCALLSDHGFEQRRFDGAGITGADSSVVACQDARDQWRRIARWARSTLESEPGTILGVVCPDLHRQRHEIEEILEDVLHPELAWRSDAPRAYHLSLGLPLSEYPVVATALDLLRWSGRRIPFEVVSRGLRSPYMDPPRESGSRIALELSLRRERSEMVSLSHLDHLAGRCPGLDQFRRQLAAARALDPPERDEPGQWAEFFSDWLRAFNWPGARPPDSREHQVLGAWRELLSRFAALGAIQDRWTLPDALRQLAAMASHRVLQFHDDRAPVQIMGATEAAGLWFDRLWLADMSDTAWPPPAQPDPFIPVPVQKAAGMPEASAANMLDHTRTRTAGLLSAATRIVVSSAAEAPDSHQSLSPLFVDCESGEPGEPGGQAAYTGRAAQLYGTQAALETIADDQAPPLADVQLQGGVGPIADQASCPFRALAHHRLAAGALDEAAPGLDARERGSLLHDALKRLWDRLGDQQALAALDQDALDAITAEAAAGALTGMFVDSRFRQRILDIERGRLTRLLREWLTVEMQRPWFRVVGTEVEMLVELAGVSFRVRADRVDELADGRRLIIDYKTGRLAGTRSWTQARITEPQLPMYALGLEGEVAALALAGVRRGECALRGIADGDDVLPSLAAVQDLELPDMASLRTHWASALARLAQGFRQGDARVDPIDADACRLCDVHALCRIFERGGSAR